MYDFMVQALDWEGPVVLSCLIFFLAAPYLYAYKHRSAPPQKQLVEKSAKKVVWYMYSTIFLSYLLTSYGFEAAKSLLFFFPEIPTVPAVFLSLWNIFIWIFVYSMCRLLALKPSAYPMTLIILFTLPIFVLITPIIFIIYCTLKLDMPFSINNYIEPELLYTATVLCLFFSYKWIKFFIYSDVRSMWKTSTAP